VISANQLKAEGVCYRGTSRLQYHSYTDRNKK